ncbi:MAG: hypothetical protein R3B72_23780 [Polyangiaceae bacterium]
MRRLTIGVKACTEIMGLLVAMAWADGVLKDEEKEGIRAASTSLNLERGLRDRLESFMATDPGLDGADLDGLSERDREFAFVACAWMARVDSGVDDAEQKLLREIGGMLRVDGERQAALAELAGSIDGPDQGASWSTGLVELFKAIAKKVVAEEIEIDFE